MTAPRHFQRSIPFLPAVTLILLFGLALPAWGQSETATLSGTITDPSGAVIVGAEVRVTNVETGITAKTTSNGSGLYVVSSIRPGHYRVIVAKPGFKQMALTDLTLNVQDTLSRNFQMQVGAVGESITVSGDVININTESGVVGTMVDRQFIENMPLNGRSFQSLISLTPGVVITGGIPSGAGQFSVNGQRSDANYFMIDGVSANVGGGNGLGNQGPAGGGSGVQPSAAGGYNNMVSVDALQEFKLESSNFAPEHGRLPGGQVSIVTRSGTNRFHGTAFEYLRNESLDANNWFNNHAVPAIKKPPERQNDFGGVFGGPVWKNRLFFFFSYEGQRLILPSSVTNSNVPSLAARANAVAAMKPILNAYPIPTGQCVAGTLNCDTNVGTFSGAFGNINNLNATSLRMDWTATKKMTLFARGNDAPSFGQLRGVVSPQQYQLTSFGLKTLTLGQTYVLKSNLTSDLRYNYSYTPSSSRGYQDNFGGAVPLDPSYIFTTPGYDLQNSAWSFGGASIGSISYSATGKALAKQQNIIENLAWVHGKHQMKFGVDYRRVHSSAQQGTGFGQGYQYSLNTNSWVNNVPNQYSASQSPRKDFLYTNTSVYAQDTWKVTSRLTLDYGLRWDVNPAPSSDVPGTHMQSLTGFDPTNLLASHIAPPGTPAYATQWNAVSPRFGFAYQVSKNTKWGRVVRGGYGLYFDTGGVAAQSVTLPSGNKLTANPGPFPVAAALAVPPPIPSAPPWSGAATVNPHFRLPYTHQMNLAVEQSLGSLQSLSVTYVGTLSRLLARREQIPSSLNPDFPNGFSVVGNGSYSDYHALQAQFQRRLSHGLQALASYTWSHSTDTFSTQFGGANVSIPTYLDPSTDFYGSSDFDIRHQFQTAITYNAPTPGHNRFVEAVMGHWSADARFGVRSALPVDIIDDAVFIAQGNPFLPGTTTSNPAGIAVNSRAPLAPGAGTTVPFFLSDPTVPGGKKINPAAFLLLPRSSLVSGQGVSALAPDGVIGRNRLSMFGWNQIDLSVRREFPIHEGLKLQFRMDAFNLMNHPSFSCNTPFNCEDRRSTGFGVANATLNNGLGGGALVPQGQSFLFQIGGPRSLQVSAKLVF